MTSSLNMDWACWYSKMAHTGQLKCLAKWATHTKTTFEDCGGKEYELTRQQCKLKINMRNTRKRRRFTQPASCIDSRTTELLNKCHSIQHFRIGRTVACGDKTALTASSKTCNQIKNDHCPRELSTEFYTTQNESFVIAYSGPVMLKPWLASRPKIWSLPCTWALGPSLNTHWPWP